MMAQIWWFGNSSMLAQYSSFCCQYQLLILVFHHSLAHNLGTDAHLHISTHVDYWYKPKHYYRQYELFRMAIILIHFLGCMWNKLKCPLLFLKQGRI